MTKKWDEFSSDYDGKVLSITSFPNRRHDLISRVSGNRVLNLGCGPTQYLNRDLVQSGHTVVATDFCQAMLDEASKFQHPSVTYRLANNMDLPFESEFDTVVTVNSIIPPERDDVVKMFQQAYKVLRRGGRLVGFFPAFDLFEHLAQLGYKQEGDTQQQRVVDTTGWQCFQTEDILRRDLLRAGFKVDELKRVYMRSPAELEAIQKLYDIPEEIVCYSYLSVGLKK